MTQLLYRYPIARETLPEELVRRLSDQATIIRAREGRTLIALGANSTSVYLVLEGRAQVTLYSLSGNEFILRDLAAGELFGELSAIDEQPRSASIEALSECVLASIPGAAFREAICATPGAALWLARRLTAQIRGLTEKLFESSSLKVSSRLHCELLRLCVPDGDTTTAVIDPAPTHAEFAARIGTHREAVTRELSYLSTRGIVEQQRRRLAIMDLPALLQLVRQAKGNFADMVEEPGRKPEPPSVVEASPSASEPRAGQQ